MVNVNASIIDQQVSQLLTELPSPPDGDESKQRSTTFVLLCVKTLLDLSLDDSHVVRLENLQIINGELRADSSPTRRTCWRC